jgi:hypothetical protein
MEALVTRVDSSNGKGEKVPGLFSEAENKPGTFSRSHMQGMDIVAFIFQEHGCYGRVDAT